MAFGSFHNIISKVLRSQAEKFEEKMKEDANERAKLKQDNVLTASELLEKQYGTSEQDKPLDLSKRELKNEPKPVVPRGSIPPPPSGTDS